MQAHARRTASIHPAHRHALRLVPLAALALGSLVASGAAAQRVERTGKEVVDSTCVQCHAKGENGAPR